MWTRFKNRLLRQKPSSSGGSADGPGSLASPANKKWGDVLPTGVGTSSSEVSGSTRDDGCRSTRSTPERNKRTTIRSRFQLFGGKSSSPKKEDNGGSRTADRKSCDATKGGHDTGSPGTASNAESDDLQSGGGGAVSRTEAKIPGDGKKRTGRGAAGGKLEGSASLERTDRPSFTDYPVWIHRVWNDDDEDDDDDEEEDLKTSSSTTTTTPLPVPRGVSTFLERSSHDPLTASCAEKVSPPRLKRRKKTVPVVETESRKSRLTAGPPPRSLEGQEAAKVIGVASVAVDGTRSPAKRIDPPRVPYDERPTVVVGGVGGVGGVGVGGGGGMVPDEFSVKLERTLEQVTNDANDSPSTGEASPDDGTTLVDSGLAGLGWRSDTSPLPLPPPPPLPVGPRIIPADGGVARLDVRTTTRKDKSMQSSSSPDFTSDDAEGKESGYVTLEDLQAQLTRSSWSGSDKESGKGGSGNGSTASSHLERKGGGLLLEETSEDMVDGGLMKMMEHGTTPPPPHHSARKSSSSSSSSRPWTNHIDDEAAAATSDLSSVLQFTFTVKLESKMFRRRAGGQSLPATRDVSPSQVKGHELISYGGGGGGGGSTHCGRPLAAAMVAGTLDFVISDKTQQRSAMNYDDDEDEVVDEVGGDALPASSVKESTNFSSSSCSRWRTGDAELPCIDRSTTKDQETEAIRSPLGTIVSRLPSTKQKKMMVHADRDDLTTCSACGQTVVVAQDIGHPPHANGHRTGNATDAVSMATTMTPSTNGRSQGDGGRGGAGGGGTRRCSRRSSSSSKQLPLVELSDNNCYVCESDEDESESPEVDDSLLPVTSFTDDDGSYLRPLLSSSDDVTGGSRSSAICKSCKSAAAAVEAVACESLMTDSYKENEMTHMNWGEVLEEAKTLGIPLHHPPNITLSSFSSDCGGGGDRRSSKSSSVSSSFNRDFANSSSTISRLLSVKADATPKSPRGSSSSSSHHHHHHHQQQQPQQHKVPPSSSSSKTGTTNVIRDLFRLQNFFSSSKSSNSSDNKENRRSSSKKSSRRSSDEVSEGSGSGGGGRHRTLMTPTSSPGPRLQSIQDRSLPPPPSSPSSPPDIDDGGGGGSSSRRPSRRSYPSRTSSICSRQGSSPMMSQSTSGPSAMRIVGCGSRAVSRSASSSRSRDYFLEEFGGSLGSSWSGGGCGGGGCVVGEGDVGMTSGVTSSKHRHMCISPSNSSFGSVFSQSSRGSSAVTPATPITPATPSADKTRSCTTNSGLFSFNKKHSQRDNDDFVTSLGQLQNCSWYWGPLSFEEAEQKLANRPDGTFIVRDSSDERYLLSLSFRSLGSTHHTRIEHYKGMFSFYSQPRSHCSAVTIVEFIEEAMLSSRGGQCLYYLRPRGPGQPPAPVRLVHPLSRFRCMHSLQHLCKFAVLRHVRLDLIDRLPIPPRLKEYLKLSQHHQHQHDHDFNSVLS